MLPRSWNKSFLPMLCTSSVLVISLYMQRLRWQMCVTFMVSFLFVGRYFHERWTCRDDGIAACREETRRSRQTTKNERDTSPNKWDIYEDLREKYQLRLYFVVCYPKPLNFLTCVAGWHFLNNDIFTSLLVDLFMCPSILQNQIDLDKSL